MEAQICHLGGVHIAHGGDPLDILALEDVCGVLQRNPDRHSIAHVWPAIPHHRDK
jgi:hypothetical protein